MEAYFGGRLGIIPRLNVPALDKLPLAEVVEALERIGALDAVGYARHWQDAEKIGLSSEVTRATGFNVVIRHRMQDVLSKTYDEFCKVNPTESPKLTTAYGWFYNWYSFKGGRQFSPYLSDQILGHATGKFILSARFVNLNSTPDVLALLREQRQNFCTIKEAMQICGARSTEGFRGLLDSFGFLKDNKFNHSAFLLRTDMEVLGKIRPHLITKENGGLILGVSSGCSPRLLDTLSRAGHLRPFMAGSGATPRTFRYLKQDLEKLRIDLDNVIQKESAPKKSVTICQGPSQRRVAFRYVCQALLTGLLTDVWLDPKVTGLAGVRVTTRDAERMSQIPWKQWEESLPPLDTFVPPIDYWRERAKHL